MRARFGSIACAVAALLAASVMRAQSGPPSPPHGPLGPASHGFREAMGPGAGPDDVIGFVGFQAGLGRNTVTGAPFSSTYTQVTTQTLPDGNHIERTTTGTLARDGNGRTMRDWTLPAVGEWANAPSHLILINDPVDGVNYVLDPDRKIARKMALVGGKFGNGPGGKRPAGSPRPTEPQNDATTTSLGTQMVNGVSAQGTRTTRTIPAGKIGNERPIVITVERWYSPDLQMNVLIKRDDPRIGENVFQLTNIVRSEPNASLFQVPSDYTVKERGMGMGRKGLLPPLPQN